MSGAAQSGTIAFSPTAPTANILQSNPTAGAATANYRISDTVQSGQTFTHDDFFTLEAVTFYIRTNADQDPLSTGALITMRVYTDLPGGDVTTCE